MEKAKLAYILSHFKADMELSDYEELNAGHIHKSYKITLSDGSQYVLQKINTEIFKDVELLMSTKFRISEHLLKNKREDREVLTFLKTQNGENYFYEKESNSYYCLSNYLSNCITLEKSGSNKIAEEAGMLFGDFIFQCSTLDPHSFPPIIQYFHSVRSRYSDFQRALQNTSPKRHNKCINYISFIESHIDEMGQLDSLIQSGKLPIRLTHNDPKLSNILFDEEFRGICVIDTDTVMPGVLAFDFGDAVRTLCSNAKEDETDESKIRLNLGYFSSFSKGFLSKIIKIADQDELNSLYLGVKTLTFSIAMRFLTDYLNHDVYYTIRYEAHNFDRAKNQFILLENIQSSKIKLEKIILEEIHSLTPR